MIYPQDLPEHDSEGHDNGYEPESPNWRAYLLNLLTPAQFALVEELVAILKRPNTMRGLFIFGGLNQREREVIGWYRRLDAETKKLFYHLFPVLFQGKEPTWKAGFVHGESEPTCQDCGYEECRCKQVDADYWVTDDVDLRFEDRADSEYDGRWN